MPYDAPLGIITDLAGYVSLGVIAGFMAGYLVCWFFSGRAWVNTNDLRACFPSCRFARSKDVILCSYRGRIYRVGGRFSSFETVCDNVERMIEHGR